LPVDAPLSERGLDESPLTPVPHRVVGLRRETLDVVTLLLERDDGSRMAYRAGQFNMLSALGVGEVAISISSAPSQPGPIRHTVRDVGPVTHAICESALGELIGVRGPFGSDWRLPETDTGDVIVVAGGVGLAPLRGAVYELVSRSERSARRTHVLVGARVPSEVLFNDDLEVWARAGAHVEVTVDRGAAQWRGRVGLVTTLIDARDFEATRARALVCGPEIMMRFTARALEDAGVDPRRILVSLERNMQCGVGWCGHCQLGPLLLCRDGPVVTYAGAVQRLLGERER
jgi:anaerobic sulfite reductase subunit B